MYTVLVVLIVILAILMCLVVLIQESKGGGLASSFSASNQIMGVRKTTDVIEKVTWGSGAHQTHGKRAGPCFGILHSQGGYGRVCHDEGGHRAKGRKFQQLAGIRCQPAAATGCSGRTSSGTAGTRAIRRKPVV